MECNALQVGATIRTYTTAVSSDSPTLAILRAVDATVDTLVGEQNRLNDFIITGQGLLEVVDACTNGNQIDNEGKVQNALEGAESILCFQYAEYNKRIEAAKADGRLNGQHEEAIIGEYSKTLDSINELYDITFELRIKVMEYDADLSPVTGSFSNADDLIAHLHSL